MRKKIIIGLSALAVLVISFALYKIFVGMKSEPIKKPTKEVEVYVRSQKIRYSTNKFSLTSQGRIISQRSFNLSTEVQGKILPSNIELRKGQSFKKGDLLFSIYKNEAYLNLVARKSRFLNVVASILPDMKIDFQISFDNWESFFEAIDVKKDLPDLPIINTGKEKTFLASRNILSDYYTIKSEESRLKKYNIYAPFDGSYKEVYLQIGSIANPGSRIANIINTGELELEIPIMARNIKWLAIGDHAVIKNDEGKDLSGKIMRISGFINETTQSVNVFLKVEGNKSPIYAGQYLTAIFKNKKLSNSMEIPRNAIFNGNEVFIIKEGKLKKRIINILKINEKTILFNGIEEGVAVVSEPLINIKENTKVKSL